MARYQFSYLQNNSQTYLYPRLIPRYCAYRTLLTLRPSLVATDSPHVLWFSRADSGWFVHRRRSPEPVSFRIAPPPLKRPPTFSSAFFTVIGHAAHVMPVTFKVTVLGEAQAGTANRSAPMAPASRD